MNDGRRRCFAGWRPWAVLLALIPLASARDPGVRVVAWHTIDDGGGTSTSRRFEVSGTIGQADAGVILGATHYAVAGGFWGIFVVQIPGAPQLQAEALGPAQVRIHWSPADPGWTLQSSDDLAMWEDSPSGATNPAILPTSGAPRFYRLARRAPR